MALAAVLAFYEIVGEHATNGVVPVNALPAEVAHVIEVGIEVPVGIVR